MKNMKARPKSASVDYTNTSQILRGRDKGLRPRAGLRLDAILMHLFESLGSEDGAEIAEIGYLSPPKRPLLSLPRYPTVTHRNYSLTLYSSLEEHLPHLSFGNLSAYCHARASPPSPALSDRRCLNSGG